MTDVRPSEQLLLDALQSRPERADRVLCNSVGRAQLALALAREHSKTEVTCWLLDLYQTEQGRLVCQPSPPGLRIVCQADAPDAEVDLVAWAFSRQGDGELAREMLQVGHERLALGGRMVVSVDNARDRWLHELMQGLFAKVTRQASDAGVVYLATKTAPLRKLKQYASEFAFRDGERLIRLRTRPGVFSHRELDGGARALVRTMEIEPGTRLLDVGCGSGAVGLAAALRAADVIVHAIDSNPRAIEAAEWGREQNGIEKLTTSLDATGGSVEAAAYDLVAANPPYYSNFRLADLFVQIARRGLKAGGRLLIVTKTPDWYAERLQRDFAGLDAVEAGRYWVVRATAK